MLNRVLSVGEKFMLAESTKNSIFVVKFQSLGHIGQSSNPVQWSSAVH